jgi:conjugative relaxase-like TrwC/TraI family protein
MLSVSRIGSPGGAAGYYTKEDYARTGNLDLRDAGAAIEVESAQGLVTYYAVPEDELGTPLYWDGKGAKDLGLEGPVDEADFRAVLYGLNPDPDGEAISKLEVVLRAAAEKELEPSAGAADMPEIELSTDQSSIPGGNAARTEPGDDKEVGETSKSAWASISPEDRIKAAEAYHEKHVAGWDLTFSAPKSVSIVALDGDGDPRLQDAHRHAVDAALGYVEQHFSVYRVREGNGERREEISGNLLMARTTHTLSRAGDPNLHDHVIVLNATKDEDGTWRALESEHIFKHMKLAGAVYQAELRTLTQELGHDVRDGDTLNTFEIAAVPAAAFALHSSRNAQIKANVAAMEEDKGRQLTQAEKEAAVLLDRPGKVQLTREELQEKWAATNHSIGLDVGAISHSAKDAEAGRDLSFAKPSPFLNAIESLKDLFHGGKGAFQRPEEALAYGREAAFHSSTVATQHDMLFRAIVANGNRLPVSDYIETGFFERPEFLQADRKVLAGLTTQDNTDREHSINAHIQERFGKAKSFGAAAVTASLAPAALSRRGIDVALTDDQHRAVFVALTSRDGVVAIQGFAGTGKTTAYEALESVYSALSALADARADLAPKAPSVKVALSSQQQLDDFRQIAGGLMGAAPTHTAVKELSDKNIQADTLSSILSRYDFGKTVAPDALAKMRKEFKGATLVVDEASMMGNRQLEKVFEMQSALKIDKVILSGDIRQIASLQAGAPFKMGMEHNEQMAKADLSTIMRQNANPTLKEAVVAFAEGKSAEGMKRLKPFIHEQGRGASDEIIADKAFELWKDTGGAGKVVVDTNKMRGLMNARIRGELTRGGSLTEEAFTQPTYRDAGMSNHDKMTSRLYQTGQTLYFFAKVGKFKAGDTLTLSALNHKRNVLEGTDRDGKAVKMDIKRNLGARSDVPFGVYQRTTTDFAVGELVLFNKTDKARGIKTNDEYRLAGFDDKAIHLQARDGSDRTLSLPRADPQLEFMTYAYAVTADKAQGKSFDSVIAVLKAAGQGDFVNHARAYIMSSRAKENLSLVTDSFRDLMRKVTEHEGINLVGLDNLRPADTIQMPKGFGTKDKKKDPIEKEIVSAEGLIKPTDFSGAKTDLVNAAKGTKGQPEDAARYKTDGAMDMGDKQKAMERPQPERSM